MLWLANPHIKMLDFKIRSIDFALKSEHFNISQKINLLKLQDELVLERYHLLKEEIEE